MPGAPSVAQLRGFKGQRQLTMLRCHSLDEAAAAQAAGIDIASVPPNICLASDYRNHAPGVFTMTGKHSLDAGHPDDYLRWCCDAMNRGADAVYCSGSFDTIESLTKEYLPVVGHVGLVPHRVTWTGGFKAVGTTAHSALAMLDECKRYEDAGAFAVEIEVVPHEVASAISQKVGLLLWSMGAGAGCDAQYLFASDVLGYTEGSVPRHAKVYRDFKAEYERLQAERIAAFSEFKSDVETGAFPSSADVVTMDPTELDVFLEALERC